MTKKSLQDERGKPSTSRKALMVSLAVSFSLLILDALTVRVALTQMHYSFMAGTNTALIAWAGGPRIAQYVGPQISKVASAVGRARNDPREPNPLKDDETDE